MTAADRRALRLLVSERLRALRAVVDADGCSECGCARDCGPVLGCASCRDRHYRRARRASC